MRPPVSETSAKDSAKTVATFNVDLKNGSEKVIEKFSVYNDSPKNMETLLNQFSVFKDKCSAKQDKNANLLTTNSATNLNAQSSSNNLNNANKVNNNTDSLASNKENNKFSCEYELK